MRKIADADGFIMVTWANAHYFDFVNNWVEHVEALGISSFVVGAMDLKILRRLLQAGIPTFNMQSNLTDKDYGWGSKTFHAMVCRASPECVSTACNLPQVGFVAGGAAAD